MLKVKQKFTKCATIEELNILYQTYMGVPVPNSQAVTLGQVHEEGEYLTQDDVDPGLHI